MFLGDVKIPTLDDISPEAVERANAILDSRTCEEMNLSLPIACCLAMTGNRDDISQDQINDLVKLFAANLIQTARSALAEMENDEQEAVCH